MTFISKNQIRFAITTDMWTASNQNKHYMTITTYFKEDSWVLQSRLVRFIYMSSPHTSEVFSDCLFYIIYSAIERVRDSVRFWTAMPKIEENFEETCEQLNIRCDKKLELDFITRWNSTFLMLHVALLYRDVFQRLSPTENLYKTLSRENYWEMANEICQKLKLFIM
ncbi:hypothetical protein Lal_00026896 [Lupinus albus]|nr:hypothetical protein Lal_00026896 [Lupinus albus]